MKRRVLLEGYEHPVVNILDVNNEGVLCLSDLGDPSGTESLDEIFGEWN